MNSSQIWTPGQRQLVNTAVVYAECVGCTAVVDLPPSSQSHHPSDRVSSLSRLISILSAPKQVTSFFSLLAGLVGSAGLELSLSLPSRERGLGQMIWHSIPVPFHLTAVGSVGEGCFSAEILPGGSSTLFSRPLPLVAPESMRVERNGE